MRERLIRDRLGVLIVLGVFSLFMALVLGLMFEPVKKASAETSLDFQKVGNTETLDKLETVERAVSEPEGQFKRAFTSSARNASAVSTGDRIQIAGKNLSIVSVGSTEEDAGNHVNRFGEKFLYGHNSGAVFGGLSGMAEGGEFTVTIGGITKRYRIVEKVTYNKISSTMLESNGQKYAVRAVANGRGKYDLAVMTCAGVAYGNGDASQRLVLYANAV